MILAGNVLMRFLVVHIISFAFIVLLVNWFSTICFAESLWKQDPGVISEFCARQGLMYGPAPGYIVTCVPPDKLDQIRKNGLCPSKLFSSGTGINGEFVWLSNEPFYHSQNGNVVLVPIEAAQRHGAYPTEGLAGQPGVWRCPNHIPPEELIFGGSSLRGAGLPGQQKKMIWKPPPAASSPARQILNPLADPPGARMGEGRRIATTPCSPHESGVAPGNESMGRVELSPRGKTKPLKNIKKIQNACLKKLKCLAPWAVVLEIEVGYRIEESGINPIEYMPGFLVSGLECLSNAEEYAKQIVSTDPFGAAVVAEYERFNRAVEEVSGGYKWARRNVDSYCDESLRNILSSGGGGSIREYRPEIRPYGTRCY